MGSSAAQTTGSQTVVVGVDGRGGGREAAALAVALLEPGACLVLATIVRPRGGERLGALFADADRQRGAQMLDAERARLGVPATPVVSVAGTVPEGLRSAVARYNADLLVVGSAHRGPIGRVLLGDDARGAVAGARCAVAIAPRGASPPPVWRTIAVGDDGSAESALALAAARRLAARFGATVRVCSVVGPASLTYRELSRTDSSDAVARRVFEARKWLSRYVGVETEVLEGDAGEALAELSNEVDLIVIGSRGQGPWGRLLTGSTGDYLARHAHCPVLVLPRGLNRSAAHVPGGPSPDPRARAVAAS